MTEKKREEKQRGKSRYIYNLHLKIAKKKVRKKGKSCILYEDFS